MLNDRMNFFGQHAISSAGFFYETLGMDIGYNFQVMLPELAEIYVRNTSAVAASMATRFADWFGYVMLREPNQSGTSPTPARQRAPRSRPTTRFPTSRTRRSSGHT
ncbi:MAG: hypothetical protein QOE03_1429 [Micromonosporaceae bacterium]|nr:hypothetical protein [Micromonosporaceae bacterium]